MRWFLDAVGLVLVLAMLAGVVYFKRESAERESAIKRACASRHRMELEVRYRSASRLGGLNARGWPKTVDAKWFEGLPPRNSLLPPERPWVEIATPEQAGMHDPPVRMAVDEHLAGFWYNPYLGIVRARVPVMVSDQEAVDLYNRVNSRNLASIFQQSNLGNDDLTAAIAASEHVEDESEDMDPTLPRSDHTEVEISATGRIERKSKE
ncbi:MAG: hypothetical protein H7210_11625 [Pyrinomonadaceae bacterium]|nr:hypothetical protein [Phycisphaerales bacterium]